MLELRRFCRQLNLISRRAIKHHEAFDASHLCRYELPELAFGDGVILFRPIESAAHFHRDASAISRRHKGGGVQSDMLVGDQASARFDPVHNDDIGPSGETVIRVRFIVEIVE